MATLVNMVKGGSGYDKMDMGFESVKTATLTNYQDVAMVVIKNKKGNLYSNANPTRRWVADFLDRA